MLEARGSASPTNMQRFTARFLLLFALFGTVAPAALQALSTSSHACCLRKSAQHCHHQLNSSQSVVLTPGECLSQNCCRAVKISKSAYTQPSPSAGLTRYSVECVSESHPALVHTQVQTSTPPRAPQKSSTC